MHSIWLSIHGDVLIKNVDAKHNGSEIGPSQDHIKPNTSSPSSSTTILRHKRHVIATETDAVHALGNIIFEALDYGIDPAEERQLSHELESMIAAMTSSESAVGYIPEASSADDEGIEKDADIQRTCTVEDVIEMCNKHLPSKLNAQHHYKAVCRALATEAGELFTFLEKISTSKKKLLQEQDDETARLEELQKAEWARVWVQVIRSLRQGVCLKKVEHINLPPVEYELTPFEMLLEDIRSHRYTLHKIMVSCDLPSKIKNNAHDVILDFIRSRPPLRKVHDRRLKPRPAACQDPHEQLLKEIRSRPKLRPVRGGRLVVAASRSRLNSDTDLQAPFQAKKVIKPDFELLLNNNFEESSDDEDHLKGLSLASSPVSDLSFVTNSRTPLSPRRHRAEHVLMRDNSISCSTKAQRRHTITICQSLKDEKKHWQNPIECLNLSLEEVTHIRSVLTKAELESLATTPELYQQVSKSKLCFTCKVTRFTLFGEWGTRCKLCQRTVCGKCIRKMNVPTDHFRNVPVYTLNPSPMTLEMQEFVQKIVRTAPPPSVPQTRAPSPNRGVTLMAQLQNNHKNESSVSLVSSMVDNRKKPKTVSSQSKSFLRVQPHFDPVKNQGPGTLQTVKGPMMAICCACRQMVTEIIRADRASLTLLTSATVSPSHLQHLSAYLSRK